MPELLPFRAIRYSDDQPLADVAAPPYDVISAADRDALIARHPHNFVHLSLPDQTPEGYESAGENLRTWLDEGVLIEEEQKALFIYRADFTLDGRPASHAGILGALELQRFGENGVFAHERTMSGPKADRLELMRTTRANLEALWFISAKPTGVIERAAAEVADSPALIDVTADGGVRHRFWRLPAGFEAQQIAEQLVVADGHHRYETCIHYRDEMRAAQGSGPWDFTLALIAEPGELAPPLAPTHRVVAGVTLDNLEMLDPQPFEGSFDELVSFVRDRGPGTIGVADTRRRAWLSSQHPLDTAFVAERVIDHFGAQVRYEHSLGSVRQAIDDGMTGFLLAPVAVETVIQTALSGGRMPPKTTLFTPKPVSGGLARRLEG